jgi:uncharacterized protein YgbK (DUF1537 family)
MTMPIFGVIADDFNGATDIASMLRRGVMQVIQTIGPQEPGFLVDADAMGCDLVAHVPALPVNGRSVFKGHLFVKRWQH